MYAVRLQAAKKGAKLDSSVVCTGAIDQLKTGIESLSGMSLDHVKNQSNSSQPTRLSALAYAQSSEIHIAPKLEQHLPHEAWHVVQQAQGPVKGTVQMKGGCRSMTTRGSSRDEENAKGRRKGALRCAATCDIGPIMSRRPATPICTKFRRPPCLLRWE